MKKSNPKVCYFGAESKCGLRIAMIKNHFTQKDLAKLLALSESSLSCKMNGSRPFSLQEVATIAAALKLTQEETFCIFMRQAAKASHVA